MKKLLNKLLDRNKKPAAVESARVLKSGDEVMVFDRYRFARPLKATIVRFSAENDGVEVQLRESNNYKFPTGSRTWVHRQQVISVEEYF